MKCTKIRPTKQDSGDQREYNLLIWYTVLHNISDCHTFLWFIQNKNNKKTSIKQHVRLWVRSGSGRESKLCFHVRVDLTPWAEMVSPSVQSQLVIESGMYKSQACYQAMESLPVSTHSKIISLKHKASYSMSENVSLIPKAADNTV